MSKKKIQEVKPDIVVEVKGGVVVGARANAEILQLSATPVMS